MTPRQKTLVQETWRQVEPIADEAASLFYDRLFEIDSGLRELFAEIDMAAQRKKLIQALSTVVDGLDRIEGVVPQLESLGRRHAGYGVRDAHYETVGAVLLWTLEMGLDDLWTAEVKIAWTVAYGLVSDVMRRGAMETQDIGRVSLRRPSRPEPLTLPLDQRLGAVT